MKINLSLNGKIPSEHLPLFNSIAYESRQTFTEFIETLNKRNLGNLDWHLTGPSERNIFTSPLFDYCCRFAFLQELLNRGMKIESVVTDSPAFQRIIQCLLIGQGQKVSVELKYNSLRQFFSKLTRIAGYLCTNLWAFMVARFTSANRDALKEKPITLIDTFVMEGFIEKDRNYPGMLDSLREDEKRLLYFVPTLYRVSPLKMFSVWKEMRTSQRKFLFKEDYLRISDYFFAWSHWLRMRKISLNRIDFIGVDFSSLIQEEIKSCNGLSSAIIALLNYRFAKRLKESGVKLRLVVDWFENQVIDKGWNSGFRKNYPLTPSIGYQGFVTTPFYLCARPTVADQKAGLLPDKIAVIGKDLVAATKEFCPHLEVITAPAFRFSHLYSKTENHQKKSHFTILAGLSFSPLESAGILDMISAIITEEDSDISFLVKKHPATSVEQLRTLAAVPWSDKLSFSDEPFNQVLEKADLLISGVSSVCMESLAKGIPVIVIGSKTGITCSPIPHSIRQDMWSICYSSDQLLKTIGRFRGKKPNARYDTVQVGQKIRDAYFAPVTTETTRLFLNL